MSPSSHVLLGHKQRKSTLSSYSGSNCGYLAEEAEVGHMQTGILCGGYWLNKEGQILLFPLLVSLARKLIMIL